MSSMSLTIIAENKTERFVLEEAFQVCSMTADTYSRFDDVSLEEDNHNVFLVALTKDNLRQAQQCAKTNMVFVIVDGVLNEAEGSNFEDIFTRPVRLGYVVDLVQQAAIRLHQRQLMAVISLGDIRLDPKNSQLYWSNEDRHVQLTEKETAVLVFLSQNIDKPVSRQVLLDEVWGYAENVETHTLETHIYRLRQKIQAHLGLDNFLVTVDEGYVLKF